MGMNSPITSVELLHAELSKAESLVGKLAYATTPKGEKIGGKIISARGAMTNYGDPRPGRVLVEILSKGWVIPCEFETVKLANENA